jgi:hypothetical protein
MSVALSILPSKALRLRFIGGVNERLQIQAMCRNTAILNEIRIQYREERQAVNL